MTYLTIINIEKHKVICKIFKSEHRSKLGTVRLISLSSPLSLQLYFISRRPQNMSKYFAVEVLPVWTYIQPRCVTSRHEIINIYALFPNTTRLPRVSGVQLGLTKSKGLYICVKVPIYQRCLALTIVMLRYLI